MKNKNIEKYLLYTLLGLIILVSGAVLRIIYSEAQGIMLTLPYILIGIGAGVFGQNLGTTFTIWSKKKTPYSAKKIEIEEKDERNVSLRNKAKAGAYDLMVMVFGALLLALALMQTDWTVIMSFVIAYLFVIFSSIYFMIKFNKEM